MFYFLAAKDIRNESGNDLVEVAQLDLASLKSVRKCAENLLEKEDKIDYLINNAGKFDYAFLDNCYINIFYRCTSSISPFIFIVFTRHSFRSLSIT